jgi:hypothetical protein
MLKKIIQVRLYPKKPIIARAMNVTIQFWEKVQEYDEKKVLKRAGKPRPYTRFKIHNFRDYNKLE